MIKPPMSTWSFVRTSNRVEMFRAWAGTVGFGVGVGGGVGVGVGVAGVTVTTPVIPQQVPCGVQ